MRVELLNIVGTEPAVNLAIEEALARGNDGTVIQVLLYRNDSCVVIGRNQNPWTETDPARLQRGGIGLFRRISGGGAVYHDLGNLNYSFILPRHCYAPADHVDTVCKALHGLGACAETNERNDIVLSGRKVSGTAYMLSAKVALHHGTLLFNAALPDLRKALQPSLRKEQVETKAIQSVRASVGNICQMVPGFDPLKFPESLEHELTKAFATTVDVHCWNATDASVRKLIAEYLPRYTDPEWTLGRTPRFLASVPNERGEALTIEVKSGRIVKATGGRDGCAAHFVTGEWFGLRSTKRSPERRGP